MYPFISIVLSPREKLIIQVVAFDNSTINNNNKINNSQIDYLIILHLNN